MKKAAKKWNGLCPKGKHGLDYQNQCCSLCPKPKEDALEKLVLAIVAEYNSDPSTPGVTISRVGKTKEWYASVVRYGEAFGEDKWVVSKARGATLAEAVENLAREWLGEASVAKDALRAVLA